MSNRPYKNVKRFVDGITKDVKKQMDIDALITVKQASDSIDFFGKVASDLENSFSVNGKTIIADLKYVEGYTGFSSKPEEQEGNYLPFSVDTKLENATLQVKTTNGTYTLDEDKAIVLIVNKPSFKITIIAKNETETIQKVYTTDLVLEPKGE